MTAVLVDSNVLLDLMTEDMVGSTDPPRLWWLAFPKINIGLLDLFEDYK